MEAEALSALPVTGFAYPHGDRDAETVDMARRAGYRLGLLLRERNRDRSRTRRSPRLCRGSQWATGAVRRCSLILGPSGLDLGFRRALSKARSWNF